MAGCAIHPTPEDVTGIRTEDIVKQIRCETRDAARQMIFDIIKATAEAGDRKVQELFVRYSEDRDQMAELDPNHLDRWLPGVSNRHNRDAIKLIYDGAVAYTFQLTMSETNNLGSTTNFLGAWQATLNLGLGASLNRQRQNIRSFTITDSFSFVLGPLNSTASGFDPYCSGHIAFGPNYIYPIAGKIGMYNTVYTFFQLAAFDGLGPTAKEVKPGVSAAPVMTDDLTFTTELTLSPTAKLTFVQVKSGFQITDTALSPSLGRKDIHEVTVALALTPKGPVALSSFSDWVYSSGVTGPSRPGAPTTLVLNRITATAATPAQHVAVHALDQAKSRELQVKVAPAQ
jgi:hypothetical protein